MKTAARSALAGTAALVFILGFPAPSLGWGRTWLGTGLEQMVKAARWKTGALRSSAAFRFGNAGYDSDLYFGQTPDPVPDYTFTAGPDIHVLLLLKKGIVIDITEIPQYVFYAKTKKERALSNAFSGRVHFVFDRLYFQAGGESVNSKDRLSTELNFKIRRKENGLSGLAFWQVSKGSALALQYRIADLKYENPADGSLNIGENLDRRASSVNLTAYLAQVLRTRFYLDAQYGLFSFRNTTSGFKNSRSYGLFGGFEFVLPPGGVLSRGLQGNISLGYKRFNVLDAQRKDFEGLAGNTSVAVKIGRATTLRVDFIRGTQFSAYADFAYYLQTTLGAGLSRALSRSIDFSYDFSFSRNEYEQYEADGARGARPSEYLVHGVRLGFRPGKNFGMDLTANFSRMNSDTAGLSRRRHFIGFNLTYGSSPGSPALSASPLSR
jgi:hypothetical protein